MKSIKILLSVSIIMVSGYACTDHNVRVYSDTIAGKWRLVGTQISPGYPVPITPVSQFPLQTLEFKSDSTVVSSVTGITSILSYSIHDDTLFHLKAVHLYGHDHSDAKGSYRFRLNDDTLRLGNIGCYEECDWIFKGM